MMEIRLDTDDLQPGGTPLHIKSPQWNEVEKAIRNLDGFRYTEICLADTDDTGLVITGGCDRYLCERMKGKENFLLIDLSGSKEKYVTIYRDEPAPIDYPEYNTIDLETALKAARTFLETGQLDSTLSWKES